MVIGWFLTKLTILNGSFFSIVLNIAMIVFTFQVKLAYQQEFRLYRLQFAENSYIVAKFNNWFTQDNVFLQGLI
jgi:hypothetical protein